MKLYFRATYSVRFGSFLHMPHLQILTESSECRCDGFDTDRQTDRQTHHMVTQTHKHRQKHTLFLLELSE